jgi:hypothetical protein
VGSFLFLSFGLLVLVGHKFAALRSRRVCKGGLTPKAESPLPNSPRSVKKILGGSVVAR